MVVSFLCFVSLFDLCGVQVGGGGRWVLCFVECYITTGKTDILMTTHSLWISQFGFSRLLQFWVCKRREFPVDGECQPIQSRGVLNGVNNFCKTNNNTAIRT